MWSMESSTVALLVQYLNTALVVILAFFAILGAIVIFRLKVLRVDTLGGKKQKAPLNNGYALLFTFCVAALAAFAAEATFFNFQYYLKLFAGPELEILDVSPDDPNVVLTSRGAPAELFRDEDENKNILSVGIDFKALNMNVTSIFVEVGFDSTDTRDMTVEWVDDLGTHSFKKKLLKGLPYNSYSPIQPAGKVSALKVIFATKGSDSTIEITQVVLNKQIPFYFSGLRLIVVSFLLFALLCVLRKELRTGVAYYLLEYKFNPASRKQNLIYALTVIMLILFSYICINTSYSKMYLEYPVHQQYNKYLVDALIEGRTWLNYGNSEKLLKAERPYDNKYRIANGYKFNADVMWDWAWYKGKFYCYFGIVPAVILYLPYKLITGEYLSNNAGVFLFTSAIIVLMAMLWRFCVRKYMLNIGFVFYLLSYLSLFFASCIFAQLRFPRVYSIAQTSGLMFTLAGCLLLLKSIDKEKINHLKLFFACLCLALIAGCRPNMIFVSLLVPFVLWRYRSWKLFALVAIPYVIVAIPLCVYNYIRFDSIFEFGITYNMTSYDISASGLVNPFAKIIKTYYGIVSYLFTLNKYSLYFPFVECSSSSSDSITLGFFNEVGIGSGMVNFPIVFCLLYMIKSKLSKKADNVTSHHITQYHLLLSFIVVAAVIAIVDSFLVGFSGRYTLDFAFFIILPSLFCAHYWCADRDPQSTLPNKNRLGVVLALLAVSIFVGSFLCVSGGFVIGSGAQITSDPVLYRYLEYSLGILRNV